MTERIEVRKEDCNVIWNPYTGEETLELLRSKGFINSTKVLSNTGQRILDETHRIMQACGNPENQTNVNTGLVIGYVQSGKTLSFTTLTALARDNNYQIVIILGGAKINLLEQSTIRLKNDLKINERFGLRQKWLQITNPENNDHSSSIANSLDQWRNPSFPNDRCKTVLITVMKNGNRLQNLITLLSQINLDQVPTIIIDDESDQASLNTKARRAAREGLDLDELTEREVSTIYRRITDLRNLFPHHTFLQYTATPQANLFINILDRLSPNFIKLLTPGDNYTGGQVFFGENSNLIIEIPPTDLSTPGNTLHEPPESLIRALQFFYLGVVAGEIKEDQNNRSMLIHPSRLQADHATFYDWVCGIKESWARLLSSDATDEKNALLAEFQVAYNDLQLTVHDFPSFEDLSGIHLVNAIQYTPIVEVNTREKSTPPITWSSSYSWILIGGQSMDRGFTVEGLTVTYMPRNIGVGNVDTVQQRARFFGYKKEYLGYCRVFIDQVTIDAYNHIIDHEEDVREQLSEYNISNKHLNEWDRRVVLDSMLNLTRSNILYDPLERDRFGNEWFRIKAPHDTESLIESNREVLFEYLQLKKEFFTEDLGHIKRTEEQRHLAAKIRITDCLENLLTKMKFTRESDSTTYSSLRGIIKRYLNYHPQDDCMIYLMSAQQIDHWEGRTRRLDKNDEIQQLFQGKNPRSGEIIYPGDAEIKNANLLSIQIHLLNFRDTSLLQVPTLAIWIPEHIGVDLVRQA
ncbi:Z1 domain protein [Leptospira broomii serovar Hurstbridge str. 5399]|uniref:Z1 domain protein n=1 Tax=Leptospira broomii serovar Hurstbridge str. 5399 TaxID=1049789 RepID=T0GI08_9LEPT|nr:Z1 domain-containing protein [Leptospira broomii]EQA46479.1 Z1 domain protein [Leptospira broomii serovar Hurstbridge str. 5399]